MKKTISRPKKRKINEVSSDGYGVSKQSKEAHLRKSPTVKHDLDSQDSFSKLFQNLAIASSEAGSEQQHPTELSF